MFLPLAYFHFVIIPVHLLFLLFWTFTFSAFPSSFLAVMRRVISIMPDIPLQRIPRPARLVGFVAFVYIFFSVISLVFLVSPFFVGVFQFLPVPL